MKFSAILLFAALLLLPARAAAGELIVSAAASLTDAFKEIETAFEAAHPGVDAILNLAGSGALYRQISQGAPVDVFASANPLWMERAVEEGLASPDDVATFAQNSLVLAVPANDPAQVKGVSDLEFERVTRIGIGTPRTVPAGQYAKAALSAHGLYAKLEPKMIFAGSVRQTLDYLVRGEVDCAFVYRTDALRSGDTVRIVEDIPLTAPVTYPLARLTHAPNHVEADAFVRFVLGLEGQRILARWGFLPAR